MTDFRFTSDVLINQRINNSFRGDNNTFAVADDFSTRNYSFADDMNTSLSSNSTLNFDEPLLTAPPTAVLVVVLCCLLVTFCVVGNLLVILSFFNDPALQVITNYWIVSLSLTDIILAVAVMPLQMTRELYEGKWTLGPLACDVFICMDVLCCTCSIYHLCLISLDRYFCVRFPFAYPQVRTRRATLGAIGCTWLMCILISLPRLFGWKDFQPDQFACLMTNKVYMLFSSVLSFYFPLFLILCMYMAIYKTTHARSRKFNRNQRPASEHRLLRQNPQQRIDEEMTVIQAATDCGVTAVRSSDDSSNELNNGPGTAGIITVNVDQRRKRFAASNLFSSRFINSISLQALVAHSLTFDSLFNTSTNSRDSAGDPVRDTTSPSDSEDKKWRFRPFFTVPSASDVRRRNELSRAKLNRRRQKQENKAAKVVVIVLAAFVLLWAPFFIVNVIGPLCPSCHISDDVFKLVTWLGYCNSAVNPAIYTFFNRTFRRAIVDVCRKCVKLCFGSSCF